MAKAAWLPAFVGGTDMKGCAVNLLPWIAIIVSLTVVGSAHSSVEKNLEVATGMTCEQLLYDATTLYGSIIDIEYAISFALEELDSISERFKASGDHPDLRAEQHEIYLIINRTIAMHRLFQKRKCPLGRDWYSVKPTEIGRNSRWD